MMNVTTADFHVNMDKYLDMIDTEDIFIMRQGETIAHMTRPKTSAVDSLRGLLKNVKGDITRKTIREERYSRYESNV